MRTTLNIDDDVLTLAREIASQEGKPLCRVITDLAREALRAEKPLRITRNGVPLLPIRPGAALVTDKLVRKLQNELQ